MAIKRAAYLDAAIKLLPVGLAWNRALDSQIAKLLDVRAEQLEAVNNTAHRLIEERMPGKAILLLEEWESYLGLPECGRKIEGKTLLERQLQVKQKEDEVGSNSRDFLEEIARQAGYHIRVIAHHPHHCLKDCTYPLYEQANHWRVFIYIPAVSTIRHANCLDDVLKNLVLFERNKELECLLKRYEYAHLEFVFIYKEETV